MPEKYKKNYIVKRPSDIIKVWSINCTNKYQGGLFRWKRYSKSAIHNIEILKNVYIDTFVLISSSLSNHPDNVKQIISHTLLSV